MARLAVDVVLLFQSTPPTRRVTCPATYFAAAYSSFQSTPPTRRVTIAVFHSITFSRVSIHTPHEEGDSSKDNQYRAFWHVSIHTPHEEGDQRCRCCY